ncbi:MAG: hypothetical protein CMLOHMNK_01166 [Steroidobacteraceae bacterium]|nr:hypothetical protein [Steroidobacteraceae bacterium]
MKSLKSMSAAALPLLLGASGLAAAHGDSGWAGCTNETLTGRYIFNASGFTRPATSVPGTPWVPKAIIEVLQFNGDGTVTVPGVTVANPFGDLGSILQPPAGAPGVYSLNEDCSGTLQFGDANGVTFRMYVAPRRGHKIWLIQTNPANNVFQGTAQRVGGGD